MRKDLGFTLVELMITVAIMAILMSLAAPSFFSLLADQRLSGAANSLLSDIGYSRSEALRRSVNVSACPSTDPSNSNPSCSSNDWSVGWIVFVDTDGDGSRATTGSETLLRAGNALTGLTSANGTSGGTDSNFVRFNARGISPGGQQSIALTNGTTTHDRTLCLASSGRPRVVKGSTC